ICPYDSPTGQRDNGCSAWHQPRKADAMRVTDRRPADPRRSRRTGATRAQLVSHDQHVRVAILAGPVGPAPHVSGLLAAGGSDRVAILAGPVGPAPPPLRSSGGSIPLRCDPRRSRRAGATSLVHPLTSVPHFVAILAGPVGPAPPV